MRMTIRPETASDIPAIESLTMAAFFHAPHTSHTEQFIVHALREAGQLTVSLVADNAGILVGHVAVSPVFISAGPLHWYGLGPISVAPEYQGQGIGTQLMEHALAALRDREACGCVVLGDPRYYGRFGFRAESSLVLPGVPASYFQAVTFKGSVPTGTVSYHVAFEAQQ